MLSAIQQLVSQGFDWLLWPVSEAPRAAIVWSAFILSVLAGGILHYLTPQQLLARLSALKKAELLAIRLFADQPLGLVRSLGRLVCLVLSSVCCYLPGILLLLPLGLLIEEELASRFARRPLLPGEKTFVTLQFAASSANSGTVFDVELVLSTSSSEREYGEQFRLIGPVRDLNAQAMYWELQAAGPSEQTAQGGGEVLEFRFPHGWVLVPMFLAKDPDQVVAVVDRWELPTPLLAANGNVPAGQIKIDYPERVVLVLGAELPWWSLFLLVFISMLWVMSRR